MIFRYNIVRSKEVKVMIEDFETLEQVYHRLKPALYTKKVEMQRRGITYIQEQDIWNYLQEVRWKRTSGLTIADMVNDILNTNDYDIESYLKEKLNMQDRSIYFGTLDSEVIE